MSRRVLLHFAALGALMLAVAAPLPAAAQAAVGAAAPSFDLPGTGGPVRLADLRGRVVLVDFWASWCAPCKQSFPWLQVVAINVDGKRADADRFLATTPVQFAIAFDPAGNTPKAYAIKGMPSSFIVSGDGKVLYAHTGFRDSDKDDLEEKIRQALMRR
ncbi:MAG: TlpA family protein disulfide reductase [Burkholderiaceae bacterium]|nr:TlpA family protein disulfide reductase [Burkholderiaceae bacterium]